MNWLIIALAAILILVIGGGLSVLVRARILRRKGREPFPKSGGYHLTRAGGILNVVMFALLFGGLAAGTLIQHPLTQWIKTPTGATVLVSTCLLFAFLAQSWLSFIGFPSWAEKETNNQNLES